MSKSWSALIDRVQIRFPLPLQLRASSNPRFPDDVELHGMLEAPDIINGEPTRVFLVDFPPPIETLGLDRATQYLRDFALRLLAHELDETFIVDEQKFYDPHTQVTYVPRRL